jgi:hypothetical protein
MLERGTTLAGYRIDGVLGQGGMGTVYEATQLSLDRVVALKLLAAHLSDDIGFRTRFKREGQVQARLEHPHIVTVYEAGETEHGLFIAMRLVRGRTLKNLITSRELDVHRTLKILGPVAEALDEAHAIGLIHRDIKPQNVLVGGRDHSFLADFGLTKATTETSLTKTGHFVGTFDYIPPEQINGERATSASDIYSLAGVLYECLTGEVPYPKPAEAAVLYAHVADPPPRPTAQRPDLPPHLDEVVGRGMAKDPAARYSSASELIQEVRSSFPGQHAQPGPVGDTRTAASPRPAAPPPADLTAPGPTAPAGSPAAPAPRPPAPVAPAAPPPRAPATPARRPPPARGRPAALPLLAAGALAAVVVAGLLIGNATSGGDAAPDKGKAIPAGSLGVRAPASWDRADRPVRIKGLPMKAAVSLLPAGAGTGASVTVGKSNGTGSRLLPAALVRDLDSPPESEGVKLGDIEALRYAALGPAKLKEGTLRLYAAPITDGVATVACVVPPAAATGSLTDACDRTAASLRLKSGRSYPLGPDGEYHKALDIAIKPLNQATKKRGVALRKADTPAAQASAAESLRTAYRNAAESLRGATHNPQVSGVNDEIIAALRALAGRYGQLAAAARADKPAAYGTARYFIGTGEKRLRQALAGVRA